MSLEEMPSNLNPWPHGVHSPTSHESLPAAHSTLENSAVWFASALFPLLYVWAELSWAVPHCPQLLGHLHTVVGTQQPLPVT